MSNEFRVLTYDRRGHGDSDRPSVQGRVQDDVDELAGLLGQLDLAPAHLVGNSYGGMVALRMAVDHPEMCASVAAHEPPFLHPDPETMTDPRVGEIDRIQRNTVRLLSEGDVEEGIRTFINAVSSTPWEDFPEDLRAYFRAGAPSFVDDVNDPDPWTVDVDALGGFPRAILLTQGTDSKAFFGAILDQIAKRVATARRVIIPNTGHGPHVDQPAAYARIIREFISDTTQ